MPHDSRGLLSHCPAASEAAARHVRRLMDAERRWAVSEYAADGRGGPATVGIVGAGVMGTSIAAAVVRHRIPVWIVDQDEQAVAAAPQRVARHLGASSEGADSLAANVAELVHAGGDLAAAAGCEFVVESVVEKVAVKQQLLTQLEPLLTPVTIVASNTSTIPWAQLAKALQDPGRLCGGHFFLPVGQAAMLEIIRGRQTRDATISAAVAFANAIGHLPLVVSDAPGFVVNRLLVPYLAEAMHLLTEGVAVEAIESAARDFGMARGPLRLLDEIGLDTALECAWTMSGSSSDLVVRSPLLVAMVKARQLGRKTQAGFFLYDGQAAPPRSQNPFLATALSRWLGEPATLSAEAIVVRLMAPMILEATRMLQRGSVRDAAQIDLAILGGFGFPESRGGLMYWADQLGTAEIVRLLGTLEHLGPRVRPTPLLLEMAERGRRFYQDGDPGNERR